nr:hypothetical protein L203_06093 [Cryptococcus depauperatus CBS 7841]
MSRSDGCTSTSLDKRKAVAASIRDACLNAGFFYVKNHDVPLEVVDKTFQQSKNFFEQSVELKRSVDISKSGGNFRGYMGLLTENNDPANKGDMHEAFNIGLDPSLDPASFSQDVKEGELRHSENLWPEEKLWKGVPVFRQANLNY